MTVLKRDYESYLKSLQSWRDQANAYSDSIGGGSPQMFLRQASGWQPLAKGANGWEPSGALQEQQPGQWMKQAEAEGGYGKAYVVAHPTSVSERLVATKDQDGNYPTDFVRDPIGNYREDATGMYQLVPTYAEAPSSATPPAAPSLTLAQMEELKRPDPDVAMAAGMINNDSKGTVAQRFAGFGNDDSSEGMVARAIKETKR